MFNFLKKVTEKNVVIDDYERRLNDADRKSLWYQSQLYHAWNVIRQQQKGLKRLSAKIRRRKVNKESYLLDSRDFAQDVTITITGDFKNEVQRKACVDEIVRRLNAKPMECA